MMCGLRLLKHYCGLLSLLWVANSHGTITDPVFAQKETVRVRYAAPMNSADTRHLYFAELLKEALELSESKFGPFSLEGLPMDLYQGRNALTVASEELIEVFWTMTSRERESILIPVRVPLLKGLMGYRIFLIKPEKREVFANISKLSQLKNLAAGQGYDWPDTSILEENGFKVITGPANTLHSMLEKGRFDYFPRGIQEIVTDANYHSTLMIEPSLMIFYPAPVYFFVGRHNQKLAERLAFGLELSRQKGSFERIFKHHHETDVLVEHLGVASRRIIKIRNPLLSNASQALTENPQLWLDLSFQCNQGDACELKD